MADYRNNVVYVEHSRNETVKKYCTFFRFPYDADVVEWLKLNVPSSSRRWHASSKRWEIMEPHVKDVMKFLQQAYSTYTWQVTGQQRTWQDDQRDKNAEYGSSRERERQKAEDFTRNYSQQNSRRFYEDLFGSPVINRSDTEVLFVLPDAPPEVVDAAYRALSRLYHPDMGGDAEKMKVLNASYDRLKKGRK